MRLKSDFITYDSEGEQIIVSVSGSFAGIARGNKTTAFIVNSLKEETDIESIINKMLEKYNAPREIIESDVNMVIEKLRSIGALEE